MAKPTLSADEQANLTAAAANATAAAATFQAQIAAQAAAAAKLGVTDGAFQKFFSYYNSIIGSYDTEKQSLNGTYQAAPITEADIIACANIQGGRIQPGLPATDIVRIAEFDGGNTLINALNEAQHIIDQAAVETALKTGYGAGTYAATTLTSTAVTSATTSMTITDTAATFSIAVGAVFVVSDGTNLAVLKCTSFNLATTPVPPPYVATVGVVVIVAPAASIASGQGLLSFTGFTNAERTSKTATNSKLQPLMTNLVNQLKAAINNRVTRLGEQLTALAANQDPDGTANIAAATTNVNNSKTFLNNYLTAADVSDTGLASLSTDRSARSTQITSRVTQITAAYTGQTENYYNQRYEYANDRANTARGTLRLQLAAASGSTQSATFASTLTSQAAAYNKLLP